MYRFVFVILMLLSSAPSVAHSGHDHSSPMAALVHLFWLAPLMVAVAVLFVQLGKRLNNSKDKS